MVEEHAGELFPENSPHHIIPLRKTQEAEFTEYVPPDAHVHLMNLR